MQTYGRWESTVYLVYVETADADRREWEETRGDNEVDPIRENFDIFGHSLLDAWTHTATDYTYKHTYINDSFALYI